MESETPVDVRIFFKDKKNELKGPYTERQVQDWYRQNWFDSSFPFYFMKGDERPTEQTEFITLDTLRTLNGIGCPFAPVKPKSNSEKIEEKIAKLEKELADLSKKCDGVKELEKRLEDVEKRLKELSTQPPVISSCSAEAEAHVIPIFPQSNANIQLKEQSAPAAKTAKKKPQKKPEVNSEHVGLANMWAAFYLDVLKAYETDKWNKIDGGKEKIMITMMLPAFESEPLRQKCRDVLSKKLMELNYFYCSECDSIYHNFKQIMLHVVAKQHNNESDGLHQLQKAVNMMMMKIFEPLIISLTKEEGNHIQEIIGKHMHISPSTPDLRPLFEFVNHFTYAYGEFVSPFADSINASRAQIIAKKIPRFKQNDHLGRKMMSELHEHIGDAQTCCYDCNAVTGTREQYYQHLRTLAHITKSNAMDLITLVVNMYKKN